MAGKEDMTSHVMTMILFVAMAIAMPWPCDGHAMPVIRNIVMDMSWPWACHGHGQTRGQNHIRGQTYGKGCISGQVMASSRIKILAKIMQFSIYILNLAKIMALLWYEVGHEGGHEFGHDYGQDIYTRIVHGR